MEEFVQDLNLPEFDPNENPLDLKAEILNAQVDDEYQRKRKAAEQKRKTMKENIYTE